MIGRITNSYLNRAIISNTMGNQSKYIDLNLEYSSQKKVNTLSDVPISLTNLMDSKNDIKKIDDYTENIGLTSSELKFTESTLGDVNKDIDRIYQLTTQAASETNGPEEEQIISNEIEQMLTDIVKLANTTYGGKYLFSGANINTPAYAVNGANYTYMGTTDADGYQINSKVSDDTSITIHQNGNNIFGEFSTTTVAGVTTVTSSGPIGHINELIRDMRATPPNYADIRVKLDLLKEDMDNITYYRAQVGTNLSVLDRVKNQLDEQKINSESRRSTLEDANLIEVASQMQQQQFALQASMQASTNMLKNSLLNFMS